MPFLLHLTDTLLHFLVHHGNAAIITKSLETEVKLVLLIARTLLQT